MFFEAGEGNMAWGALATMTHHLCKYIRVGGIDYMSHIRLTDHPNQLKHVDGLFCGESTLLTEVE